jgi:uncharacterized protein (DUF2141 family)
MALIQFIMMVCLSTTTANEYNIALEIKNIPKNCIGKNIYVGYWKTKTHFPDEKKADIGDKHKISGSTFHVDKSLPAGVYAVSVYVDINGNGIFDKNLFGVPKEPYCVSNNIKPTFSAPSFDECSFKLNKNSKQSLSLIL